MNTIQKLVVNAVAVLVLFGLGGCASMSPQNKNTAIAISTEDAVTVAGISGHEAGK